jgi:flagellar biosynthesis chaperone FliJ
LEVQVSASVGEPLQREVDRLQREVDSRVPQSQYESLARQVDSLKAVADQARHECDELSARAQQTHDDLMELQHTRAQLQTQCEQLQVCNLLVIIMISMFCCVVLS